MCRAKSSGMKFEGSIGFIAEPPSADFHTAQRLVDVDLAARDLLHELDSRG
jgi:hypothetical protein